MGAVTTNTKKDEKMSWYELYPGTPDEEHPAIIEHHAVVDNRDRLVRDNTTVFSQTGREATPANPEDALGFDYERCDSAAHFGRLALSGAKRSE